jgi:non-specific serine/threonine protein kinase
MILPKAVYNLHNGGDEMPGRDFAQTLPAFARFGSALKYLRRRARLSQRELSIAVGYSESQISRFESHQRPPDLAILRARFVPALGLDGQPAMAARLLDLAAAARNESLCEPDIDTHLGVAAYIAPTGQPRDHQFGHPLNNLPTPLTSFVGREKDKAAVQIHLLDRQAGAARLITLTGAGGIGKTRLALQAATELLQHYSGNVWWVDLASVTNPASVPLAIAAVLNLHEVGGYPLIRRLIDFFRPKSALLLLDNCEQCIEACAALAQALLQACSQLRLLVTSRETLGFPGEVAYLVQPLSVLPGPKAISQGASMPSEAARLFVERARAVQPDFQMTNANRVALMHLCSQLDGLPLAIELAAARLRSASLEQLTQRLDDRFRLLAGGNRTALPRHQSLTALMDWSYELLPDVERTLLRRLAVFRGGWNLQAAEAICAGGELEPQHILGVLMRLVDKSLVTIEEQGRTMRYRLLETIWQYAWDKAHEHQEADALSEQFYYYHLLLAEVAAPKLKSAEQIEWLERIHTDHANFRAAMEWALQRSPDQPAAGMRLAAALAWCWYAWGYWSEVRGWLEAALAQTDVHQRVPLSLRVQVLCALGSLRSCLGEDLRAQRVLEESVSLCRKSGDREGLAYALALLGECRCWEEDPRPAQHLLEESVAVYQEFGLAGNWGRAYALKWLSEIAFFQDDYTRAESLLLDSLGQFQVLGDRWGQARALENRAVVAILRGDTALAKELVKAGLTLAEEMGDATTWMRLLNRLKHAIQLASERGDNSRAAELMRQSLALAHDLGNAWGMAESLRQLARLAQSQNEPERAARLLGAAEAIHEASQTPLPPYPYEAYERDVKSVSSALSSASFAAAWAAGRAMTLEASVACALEIAPPV